MTTICTRAGNGHDLVSTQRREGTSFTWMGWEWVSCTHVKHTLQPREDKGKVPERVAPQAHEASTSAMKVSLPSWR